MRQRCLNFVVVFLLVTVAGAQKKPLPNREPSQSTANGPVVAPPEAAEEKALLQRYNRQLDSQEDHLSTLSKEIADLQEKHTPAQEQVGPHGAGEHAR